MKINLGTIEVAGEKKQALIPYLIGRGVMTEGDKLTNTIVRNVAIVAIEDLFSLAVDEYKLAELEKQIAAEAVAAPVEPAAVPVAEPLVVELVEDIVPAEPVTAPVELEAAPGAEPTPLVVELIEEVLPAEAAIETVEPIPAEMAAGAEAPKKRRGGRKAKAA